MVNYISFVCGVFGTARRPFPTRNNVFVSIRREACPHASAKGDADSCTRYGGVRERLPTRYIVFVSIRREACPHASAKSKADSRTGYGGVRGRLPTRNNVFVSIRREACPHASAKGKADSRTGYGGVRERLPTPAGAPIGRPPNIRIESMYRKSVPRCSARIARTSRAMTGRETTLNFVIPARQSRAGNLSVANLGTASYYGDCPTLLRTDCTRKG